MRIIIVRHGDPDYSTDTLTNVGKKEAHLLTKRLLKEKIDYVYVSPLGRAKETAQEYLQKTKHSFQILEWLKEFPYPCLNKEGLEKQYPWDFEVEYFTSFQEVYDNSSYLEVPFIKNSSSYEGYKYIISQFDELLTSHGYERENNHYKVTNSNKDTLIFFCHLGLECVLLSRFFNLPFIALAQHLAPAPSSVTVIYTEERKEGIAQFRAQCIGDISHLYKEDVQPSFAGRFRENHFDNTRKD